MPSCIVLIHCLYTHVPYPLHTCSQELRVKLLAEAEQSARQNAAVAMRWADLFSIEVPQVGRWGEAGAP